MKPNPLQITLSQLHPIFATRPFRLDPVRAFFERFLSLPLANRLLAELRATYTPAQLEKRFFPCAARAFGIRYSVPTDELARIPREGPTIVVANHPKGLADGISLGSILQGLRPDAKLVANAKLAALPEIAPSLVPVDLDTPGANAAAVRGMLTHLKGGGMLGIFPAGAISSYDFAEGTVRDDPWHPTVAALVAKTGATVVPVRFGGKNSWLFHAVSTLGKRFRGLLYLRELRRDRRRALRVSVGKPVPASELRRLPDCASILANLRLRTSLLAAPTTPASSRGTESLAPLAPGVEDAGIAREIESLPPSATLFSKLQFDVLAISGSSSPSLLDAIARLREETFRAAGEGTGKPADTDRFDRHYTHLVLWDRASRRIAGSYRIGDPSRGTCHLYTSRLFRYDPALFTRALPGSLELGRSFVAPAYQKQPLPLALLWEGIGALAARRGARYLFGAVSTSSSYTEASRALVATFLRNRATDPVLAALSHPQNPPLLPDVPSHVRKAFRDGVPDLRTLDSLVRSHEPDGKGIPVLLRHYLKLGARVLGLNVDPAFSHVLDALCVVDLEAVPPKMGRRFFAGHLPAAGGTCAA